VAIYDAGLEGYSCYIAMEFVERGNLINFCSKDKLLPLDKLIIFQENSMLLLVLATFS